MKQCSKCKISKPVDDYSKNKSTKDGLQRICVECQRAYVNSHYAKNKDYYKDKARRRTKHLKELVRDYKLVPCADCGVTYPPWVMDFDHINSSTKLMEVSKLVLRGNIDQILQEIKKCEVVCANCHRQRTYSRGYK